MSFHSPPGNCRNQFYVVKFKNKSSLSRSSSTTWVKTNAITSVTAPQKLPTDEPLEIPKYDCIAMIWQASEREIFLKNAFWRKVFLQWLTFLNKHSWVLKMHSPNWETRIHFADTLWTFLTRTHFREATFFFAKIRFFRPHRRCQSMNNRLAFIALVLLGKTEGRLFCCREAPLMWPISQKKNGPKVKSRSPSIRSEDFPSMEYDKFPKLLKQNINMTQKYFQNSNTTSLWVSFGQKKQKTKVTFFSKRIVISWMSIYYHLVTWTEVFFHRSLKLGILASTSFDF